MNRADHAVGTGITMEASAVEFSVRCELRQSGRGSMDFPVENLRILPGSARDHVHALADFDAPSASDGCVQTELSAESANDVPENLRILLGRVWIVGCHDTTPAEVRKSDLRLGQPQNRTRPLSLGETFNTADHQIRTQASEVAAEHDTARSVHTSNGRISNRSGVSNRSSRAPGSTAASMRRLTSRDCQGSLSTRGSPSRPSVA